MPKVRANQMPLSKQIEVGKFAAANKNMPLTEVVEHFERKWNYDQVVRAARKYKEGKLTIKHVTKKKSKQTKETAALNSVDELFDKQLKYALAQLDTDTEAPAVERVAALHKLQQMMLISHMKRADANIVASIIRRFIPDASDSDVVKVYSEEVAKCKNSR